MLILVLILVLIVVPACTWWFGLWNNLINVINFLLAALIATSVYHPVANRIAEIDRASYGYLADFAAIWIAFALAFIVLRGITDSISKYQLKFDPITEIAGRSVLALTLGIGMMCFTSFTLHLAPLPSSLYGEQEISAQNNKFSRATSSIPDQAWLGYVDYASVGPLAASKSKNLLFVEYNLDKVLELEDIESRQFDPRDSFFDSGWSRRRGLERDKKLRKKASEK
jgi:hypothetical protein